MQRTRREAVHALLPDERQKLILDQLMEHGRVLAADLAQEFGISEHTVRRHLCDLAEAGYCKRVYGGAIITSPAIENASIRQHQAGGRKAHLAVAAASLVSAGQIILLDAGSTNVAIAESLPDNWKLTVVTNCPAVCSRLLGRKGFEIILIGGRIGVRGGGSIGATALLQVQQIRADICFLGACAIDAIEGISVFDAEEAELKRAMVKSCAQIVVAMPTDKLTTIAPFFVAPASAADHLVVESDTPAGRIREYKKVCGNVLVANS